MLSKILDGFFPILLVIIFFCGSIIVHEFGHYIAARICGLYIPRFSIGFGPRLFSKKIGDTEFCISLLPFGGYVSLPQLADLSEIEGKYVIPEDTKPITCSAKIIVAVMGAVFNMIFALILGVVVWCTGFPTGDEMMTQTIGFVENELILDDGTRVISPAKQAGLEVGDEIISIDGSEVKNFADIQQFIALGTLKDESGSAYSEVCFIRNGEKKTATVFPVLTKEGSGIDRFRQIGVRPKRNFVIHSVCRTDIDIQPEDKLLSIDGVPILSMQSLRECTSNKKNVNVQLMRSGEALSRNIEVINIADTKPYVHVTLPNGELDIIPQYDNFIFGESVDEYTRSRLHLLCSDENFLEKYGLDDDLELIQVNGAVCTNLADVINRTKTKAKNVYTFLQSNMPIDVEFPFVESAEVVAATYRDVLGLNFKNELVFVHKSPIALIKDAILTTFKTLVGLFNHHSDVSVQNLMGPVGLFRVMWICSFTNVRIFLWFVILVNVNLAILNMLPLPILDGGCVVLALLEKLSKNHRKCVDRIFGGLQTMFLFLLIGLLLYISIFDIRRWRADHSKRTKFERQIRLKLYNEARNS